MTAHSLWAHVAQLDSPLGPVWLATRTAQPNALAGVWFAGQKHFPGNLPKVTSTSTPPAVIGTALVELAAYFEGKDAAFSASLEPVGTPFQRAVWHALLRIPRGTTSTYGAVAKAIGRPESSRAVGAAVGQNPISIIVPCHRVVGRDGSLTGYAGGLDRKTALLRLERAL